MSKLYVFGYGSLVSADDVARTLGRRPTLIYPVTLKGWLREWGVVIENVTAKHRCVRLPDGSPAPGHIVVLNVRRPGSGEEPTDPNGVLFEVTDEELREVDRREKSYRRVDVTEDVIGGPRGSIYTYSGLDNFLISNHTGGPMVIPGSYHELVRLGFTSLSPDMYDAYVGSTRTSDLPIHTQEPLGSSPSG